MAQRYQRGRCCNKLVLGGWGRRFGKALAELMEHKGEVLCESMAIAKFLAELCNLAGTTTLNKAKADEIVLAVNGIFESVAKCLFAPEGEKAGLKKKLIEETLPQKFGQLEGR